MAKRAVIDTGTRKRYVRRDERGRFVRSDDIGRSMSTEQRTTARNVSKRGQGERPTRSAARPAWRGRLLLPVVAGLAVTAVAAMRLAAASRSD